jgi:hypothetical protein
MLPTSHADISRCCQPQGKLDLSAIVNQAAERVRLAAASANGGVRAPAAGTFDTRADPSRDTRADPSRDTRADPSRDTRADPSRDKRADPTRDTRADPTRDTRADPTRDTRADPMEVDSNGPARGTNRAAGPPRSTSSNPERAPGSTPAVPAHKQTADERRKLFLAAGGVVGTGSSAGARPSQQDPADAGRKEEGAVQAPGKDATHDAAAVGSSDESAQRTRSPGPPRRLRRPLRACARVRLPFVRARAIVPCARLPARPPACASCGTRRRRPPVSARAFPRPTTWVGRQIPPIGWVYARMDGFT